MLQGDSVVSHCQGPSIFACAVILVVAGCGDTEKPAAAASQAQRVRGGCETPVTQREAEEGCYFTAATKLGVLSTNAVYWHLYQYPTREAALAAQGPHTEVVSSFDKYWLYAIADETWKPGAGEKIAVIGPLTVQPGKPYTARYMEAVFPPDMEPPMRGHRHSGPEAWYVLTGAQCLETSEGLIQAKSGEGAMVAAGPAMAISGVGPETRRAVLLVLHPTDEPWMSFSTDWTPEGRCPQ
jgi:quercetin dioxygenase-like cupin family protein